MVVSRRALFPFISSAPLALVATTAGSTQSHPLNGWHSGVIQWFSRTYDTGSIDIGNDKPRVYFNRQSLRGLDPALARPAKRVLVHCELQSRGPCALEVRLT